MTPMGAIRNHCLWCCVDQPQEVKLCTAEGCPLHAFRHGKLPGKGSFSLKAIRARCVDCTGGEHPGEVAKCKTPSCNLHPFRMGKNPNYSDEYRARQRARRKNLVEKGKLTALFSDQNKKDVV